MGFTWVELGCGHPGCWVPWLQAHKGRRVTCPYPGGWRGRHSAEIVEVGPSAWELLAQGLIAA